MDEPSITILLVTSMILKAAFNLLATAVYNVHVMASNCLKMNDSEQTAQLVARNLVLDLVLI